MDYNKSLLDQIENEKNYGRVFSARPWAMSQFLQPESLVSVRKRAQKMQKIKFQKNGCGGREGEMGGGKVAGGNMGGRIES